MRDYNKRNGMFAPLSVSRTVAQGGGAWEVTTRWSVFDGNNGEITAGNSKIFSLGLFWWLNPKFNVSANYRWINLERYSEFQVNCKFKGNSLHGESNGLNFRLMLML
jgi:phosphate-selective porin OprO/OprP